MPLESAAFSKETVASGSFIDGLFGSFRVNPQHSLPKSK